MRDPLQALLIAGSENQGRVADGRKAISVRFGHRDYKPGKMICCCHITQWARMVQVTSVRHTTLDALTDKEIHDDGFDGRTELFEGLSKYYPDLATDSEVTVIRWKLT